ncbi:MAG: response regulator transcription factor [Bacteroidetes bacterium]|nr:response regulator transcription factor [Bacteroidota bacterium]
MIKALCIDDEANVLNVAATLIERYVPEITNVQKALGANEGFEKINSFKPDLIFLDIEMPGLNGFELLEKFPQKNFDVIFVTAYNHYAVKAFKFSAIDYLLKPIDIDELKLAVKRFIEKRSLIQNVNQQYSVLQHNLHAPASDFKLSVTAQNGLHFIPVNEVLRCEADGNYTHIYTTDARHFISTRTLAEYDEMLMEYNFLRVHRSHLVNRNHITRILSDNQLELNEGTLINIARRRAAEIKDMLR